MIRIKLAAQFIYLSTFLTGLLLATGCNKSSGTSGGQPPNTAAMIPGAQQQDITDKLPGDAKYAEGKKVYAKSNCARCHVLGETGGGRAPNLSKVGGKPDHNKEWFAEHIRNAKSHNPQSRMPAFGADKISDAELSALTDYLASLK